MWEIWKDKQKTPDEKYGDLNPPGSNTGISYGLKKIHKPLKIGIPPFQSNERW